jgi:hypothetical protein
VNLSLYGGLFTVTLATLMYEILLTRIFSVTMWYHFAFMAISVGMFGMTVGAILVYLLPRTFTAEATRMHLARAALGFAAAIVVSFLTHLCIPFTAHASIAGLFAIALTYAVIAVPFVFSGICVCLALTRFPGSVGRLYAADLAGAALGCLLLIALLDVTDGPTAVIAVAGLAGLGAFLFALAPEARGLRRAAAWLTLALGAFVGVHTILASHQLALLRLVWVKEAVESRALYEKWNSFSRIRIEGDPAALRPPFGWGLSPTYPAERRVRELMLVIDANAATPLTRFTGDPRELEHLKYDVTNLAHHLRPEARVLVVGTGGGRDLLAALAFGQRAVVGVEINRDVIEAVNGRFGDFTGHLDRDPRIVFVNDEGRSYVARHPERFDIIQVSLVDTWAATAAGAFVLSENSLYTLEAWTLFLSRLGEHGILTFSRWYSHGSPETYRLVSLASAALAALGVREPRRHIALVTNGEARGPVTIGTILVKREPFTGDELRRLGAAARQLGFTPLLTPDAAADSILERLVAGRGLDAFAARFPFNVAPPTDDSPFFFNMIRLRDVFQSRTWREEGPNLRAVVVLAVLLATVIVLTALCVIVPLLLTTDRAVLTGAPALLVFFAAIGLGFMFVEISQMQRLIVFLGHPSYGLSVVLFSLLVGGGLGSYLSDHASRGGTARLCLVLLLAVLVVFGWLTPRVIEAFRGSVTLVRVLVAAGLLFPLGLVMGLAFPLGMKLAAARAASLTPWLWGINGATSVCASVLAVAISLHAGISASFWTGVTCYAAAVLAYLSARRAAPHGVSSPIQRFKV